ncbi:hypothetical protein M758_4G084500 [Ceratodon purpureus]|nr:hypothetical protein M758_4G084500 [Ceratodon purpureus]
MLVLVLVLCLIVGTPNHLVRTPGQSKVVTEASDIDYLVRTPDLMVFVVAKAGQVEHY